MVLVSIILETNSSILGVKNRNLKEGDNKDEFVKEFGRKVVFKEY